MKTNAKFCSKLAVAICSAAMAGGAAESSITMTTTLLSADNPSGDNLEPEPELEVSAT